MVPLQFFKIPLLILFILKRICHFVELRKKTLSKQTELFCIPSCHRKFTRFNRDPINLWSTLFKLYKIFFFFTLSGHLKIFRGYNFIRSMDIFL